MKLFLAKPDLTYFEDYNDMMREWCDSNTQIAPWFLDDPIPTIEEFAQLVKHLDDCSYGRLDPRFCSTTSYFVVDENDRLVGAASLRHYLTVEGMNTWGHVGYGIRPTERRKGYATMVLKMLLDEAEKRGIRRVFTGAYSSNIGSCKTIEKCGFSFVEEIQDPQDESKRIRKYRLQLIGNSNDAIKLVEISQEYADDIWAFRREVLESDAQNEDQFAGCRGLDESKSPEEWIDLCGRRQLDEWDNKEKGNVPSHTYLAIRPSDNRIVGIIDLRHHIDHPILGTWGGHSGYSVRPSERGHGYAKEMLRLNLLKAKEMGITKVLVTCSPNNIASEKTILANGGEFECMVDAGDGEMMKRYWIDLL